ncbi:glycosyltransferase, partial [Candidatus Omnitrophota bacterium]
MTVSIIIAVKTRGKNLEDCVSKCLALDYPDFEIIILPDKGTVPVESIAGDIKGTVPLKVIPTGAVSPAKKRDIAMEHAKGEILAFIDDDAYPQADWLKEAMKNFSDPRVAAVGGPAVTPKEDDSMQQASGAVYSNLLVSAKHVLRYLPLKRQEVDDYPSCNFFVRKSVLQELGGFQTDFWPGEDTKLCLDITKRLLKKIIYDPKTLVFHHRRPLFLAHLKQVASYALHRGYFVKRFPETSRRFSYFVPTLFLLYVAVGAIFSMLSVPVRSIYLAGIFFYLFTALLSSISSKLRLIPLVFAGVILTHLTYGAYFLKGIISRR